MKSVVMLSTMHELQMSTNDRSSELKKCLAYLKSEFKAQKSVDIQVVMEEWHDDRGESAAREFATRSGLQWANVGTPDEGQFRTYRNPICFCAHNGTLRSDGNAPQMREYGPFEKQEARENRMVQNVRAAMQKYESGILIVGDNHLHSIFGKLRSSGFNVCGFSYL
jgi:hypothetical protein